MSGSEQVIVEDALPQPLFEQCKQALLQMAADEVAKGTSPLEGSDRGGGFPPTVTAACFSQANDLQLGPLRKLLTTEKILPKVIDIMGTNTTCYHFHCNVTPGQGFNALSEGDDSDGGAPEHPDFETLPCFGFHQVCAALLSAQHIVLPELSDTHCDWVGFGPPGRLRVSAGAAVQHEGRLLLYGRLEPRDGEHLDR